MALRVVLSTNAAQTSRMARCRTMAGVPEVVVASHALGFVGALLSTRFYKHLYCGVVAPNAILTTAETATVGPVGETLQVLRGSWRTTEPEQSKPGMQVSGLLSGVDGEHRIVRARIEWRLQVLSIKREDTLTGLLHEMTYEISVRSRTSN